MSSMSVVILAAGKGTRMKSRLPKVLHPLAGKPLLSHVISTAKSLNPHQVIVVTGHESDMVRDRFRGQGIEWVEQEQQNGTGHAVQECIPTISGDTVLVLYGDVPLLSQGSLKALGHSKEGHAASVLTMTKENPFGYGRIINNEQGFPVAIVEEKDASDEQKQINEVNTGVLIADTAELTEALGALDANNAQGELYLTDVVDILVNKGKSVSSLNLSDPIEAEGVNSRVQLEALERVYQARNAERLMDNGVTIADKSRIDVRGSLSVGHDSFIDVNCVFEGNVTIGENVTIESNCLLKDCTIGPNTTILANTVIESASLASNCAIGPFARIRPGTELADNTKLGNFVETKNAIIGKGSKVNHLSYVGDAEIGESVNVGAGTITCNYDGANKHKTIIEDGVFVGSNTALVAPITVGENATIGAGATLSNNVPANKLTYARSPVKSSSAWKRPIKEKKT